MEFDSTAAVVGGVIWLLIVVMMFKFTLSSQVDTTWMKIIASVAMAPICYFIASWQLNK